MGVCICIFILIVNIEFGIYLYKLLLVFIQDIVSLFQFKLLDVKLGLSELG